MCQALGWAQEYCNDKNWHRRQETDMQIENYSTMEWVQSWNCDQNVGDQWKKSLHPGQLGESAERM